MYCAQLIGREKCINLIRSLFIFAVNHWPFIFFSAEGNLCKPGPLSSRQRKIILDWSVSPLALVLFLRLNWSRWEDAIHILTAFRLLFLVEYAPCGLSSNEIRININSLRAIEGKRWRNRTDLDEHIQGKLISSFISFLSFFFILFNILRALILLQDWSPRAVYFEVFEFA